MCNYQHAAAAKLAFDRCVEEKKIEDDTGSYYINVHYNYDFVEDFRELFSDQGPKIQGDSCGREIFQKQESQGNQVQSRSMPYSQGCLSDCNLYLNHL